MPLDIETASSIALLSAVLKRGNEKFGEMDKIGAFLEKNYGASLSVSTSKAGELQSLSFTIRFLSDRFAIEKEPVAQNLGFPCSTPVYLNLLRKKADLKRHLSSRKSKI